jgi:hypothetical protein
MNVQYIGRPNQMTDMETKERRVADDGLKGIPLCCRDRHTDNGFHKPQRCALQLSRTSKILLNLHAYN